MQELVYVNGDIIAKSDARISVMDRGFLLGDGVFDTMLAKDGVILDGLDHMDRLLGGAMVLGLAFPLSSEKLLAEAEEFTRLLQSPLTALRVTLTRGETPRGLAIPDQQQPNCVMTAAQGAKPNMNGAYSRVRAMTHDLYKINEYSPLSRLKTLNYLEPILGLRDAKALQFDEVLMTNFAGNYACGSVSNLFVLKGDQLLTPALNQGCLDGITRRTVIDLGQDLGLSVTEGQVSKYDIVTSDHVFQCNSLMGWRGLSGIDETIFDDPFSYPAFQALYKSWLAYLDDRLA